MSGHSSRLLLGYVRLKYCDLAFRSLRIRLADNAIGASIMHVTKLFKCALCMITVSWLTISVLMIASKHHVLKLAGEHLDHRYAHSQLQHWEPDCFLSKGQSSLTSLPGHEYAFCTLLAPREKELEDEEDVYYVGARMLAYQLLHDPHTRSRLSIPFLVLASAGVAQWKLEQLSLDGATVIEVVPLNISWIKPGRPRWAHVMDKLYAFKLARYAKLLLLDTDIVVLENLDKVFEDSATSLRYGDCDFCGPRNITYTMAATSGSHNVSWPGRGQRGPEEENNNFNAGFVVLHPAHDLFEYYLQIAEQPGQFDATAPEQNLWNYVHQRPGCLPWQQLDPLWTINTPVIADLQHKPKTVHEKFWGCARDRKLRDVLLKSRWKMEGFFNANRKSRLSARST